MSPRTWDIFEALGLAEEFSKITNLRPKDEFGECDILKPEESARSMVFSK